MNKMDKIFLFIGRVMFIFFLIFFTGIIAIVFIKDFPISYKLIYTITSVFFCFIFCAITYVFIKMLKNEL